MSHDGNRRIGSEHSCMCVYDEDMSGYNRFSHQIRTFDECRTRIPFFIQNYVPADDDRRYRKIIDRSVLAKERVFRCVDFTRYVISYIDTMLCAIDVWQSPKQTALPSLCIQFTWLGIHLIYVPSYHVGP